VPAILTPGKNVDFLRQAFWPGVDRCAALPSRNVDRVFTDRASGKDTERPQLRTLLSYAREGDTIVVHSMDRLARNVDDLRRIVLSERRRGVRMQFIKEGS
jgi:DNA invertase Pin-like site-specific DNA recombinase